MFLFLFLCGGEEEKNRNYLTLPFFQTVHVEWGAAAGSLSLGGVCFVFCFRSCNVHILFLFCFYLLNIFLSFAFFSPFLGGFVIWGRSRGEGDLGEGLVGIGSLSWIRKGEVKESGVHKRGRLS